MLETPQISDAPIESIEERIRIGGPLMFELAEAISADPLTRQAYNEALAVYEATRRNRHTLNLHFPMETSMGVKLTGSFYLDHSSTYQRARISLRERESDAPRSIGSSVDEKDHVITDMTFHAGILQNGYAAAEEFKRILAEFFGPRPPAAKS
jgi:hypothetical protein